MNPLRTSLVIAALALPIPAAVAGCGDDSGDEDPQQVVEATFSNDQTVSSGVLDLSVSGSAEGAEGGSFEASLSGPFQGDPDDPTQIPQLDFTGSVGGTSAGQSIDFEGGLTVTEDNAYVEFGGQAYELGTEAFSQFKQLAEQAAQQQQDAGTEGLSFGEAFQQGCEQQLGASAEACQIDFQGWLTNLSNDGTEDIDGTEAVHISGDINIDQMLQDVVELASAAPDAGEIPSEEEIQQVSDAITEASFDLYSGTEDDILRGLDFDFAIDATQVPDADTSEVSTVDVSFSMRLSGVNEEQTIEAPADAQPLEGLLSQYGIDPSALGGGLGGLGGGGALGGGSGLGGTGSGGSGDPNAYFDCIEQAQTAEEINACASQL